MMGEGFSYSQDKIDVDNAIVAEMGSVRIAELSYDDPTPYIGFLFFGHRIKDLPQQEWLPVDHELTLLRVSQLPHFLGHLFNELSDLGVLDAMLKSVEEARPILRALKERTEGETE